MAKKTTIKKDPFVAKIVPAPAQPTASLLFTGFVGAGERPKHLRVYSDAELRDYLDIPEEAVLHTQALSADESPLGGSYLWVKHDALIVHNPVDGSAVEPFLKGPVYADYLKNIKAIQSGKKGSGAGITRFGCPGDFGKHRAGGGSNNPPSGPGPSPICH